MLTTFLWIDDQHEQSDKNLISDKSAIISLMMMMIDLFHTEYNFSQFFCSFCVKCKKQNGKMPE